MQNSKTAKQQNDSNFDTKVVQHFGKQWHNFTGQHRPYDDLKKEFDGYFSIFPWDKLPANAEGFDAGCGNGRWAEFVLNNSKVGHLNCIEPSSAIEVAKDKLRHFTNVTFINTTIGNMPISNCSQDFGYCLGVLHYIPDAQPAMQKCVDKLKPGAPFLVYMYYNFENRPLWFKCIWKLSDLLRKCICHLPHFLKTTVTNIIATLIYWPLSQLAAIFEKLHLPYKNIPLSAHRHGSFYDMRNCALDRFGPCLEKRFSKADIVQLMTQCGLENIEFSNNPDTNWVAIGYKSKK